MSQLFVPLNKIQIILAVCMFFSIQAVSGQVFYKGKSPENTVLKGYAIKTGFPFHADLILAANSIKPVNNFLEVSNTVIPFLKVENLKSLADLNLMTENKKAMERVCEKSCRKAKAFETSKVAERKVQKESAKAKQNINLNDLNLFISF